MIEFGFDIIPGIMLGAELHLEEEGNAFILDLFIIRFVIQW